MKFSIKELLNNDNSTTQFVDQLISEGFFNSKKKSKHSLRIEKFSDRYPDFPNDEVDGNFVDGVEELKEIYADIINDNTLSLEQKNSEIDLMRSMIIEKIKVVVSEETGDGDFSEEIKNLKLERINRFTLKGQKQLKQNNGSFTRLGVLERLLNSLKDAKTSSSSKQTKDDKHTEKGDRAGEKSKDSSSSSGNVIDEIAELLQEDDFNEAVSYKVAGRIIKRVERRMNRGKFNDSILREKIGPILQRADIDDKIAKEILDVISDHYDLSGGETKKPESPSSQGEGGEDKSPQKNGKKLLKDKEKFNRNILTLFRDKDLLKDIITNDFTEDDLKGVLFTLYQAGSLTEQKISLVSLLLENENPDLVELWIGDVSNHPIFQDLLKSYDNNTLVKIFKHLQATDKLAKPNTSTSKEHSNKNNNISENKEEIFQKIYDFFIQRNHKAAAELVKKSKVNIEEFWGKLLDDLKNKIENFEYFDKVLFESYLKNGKLNKEEYVMIFNNLLDIKNPEVDMAEIVIKNNEIVAKDFFDHAPVKNGINSCINEYGEEYKNKIAELKKKFNLEESKNLEKDKLFERWQKISGLMLS